jgi:glucokinase
MMYREAQNLSKWLLGVDVGGTKIATLLVDTQWQAHEQLTVATDLTSPQHTLDSIISAIQETLRRANVAISEVGAIGLGIPGQVNSSTGVVNLAVNLHWDTLPVGTLLRNALNIPCFLENDVRAAAWGLHRFDRARSGNSLAYLSIGTGISAGLVLQGQLYRGVHGMAGEVGHSSLDPHGPRCSCGGRGCLEMLASGPAIARMAQAALAAGTPTSLRQLAAPVTAAEVYAAAAAGDAVALAIAEQVGQSLGRAIYNLALSYDVERIIVGGGVTTAGAAFFQPIGAELNRLREESQLARALLAPDLVSLVPSDYNVGGWGGVALAEKGLHHSLSLPAAAQQRIVHTTPNVKEGLLAANR